MDTSNQITFIIPNRGGKNIDFVIKKLREFYPNSEYIVITQDDDNLFMRGQLWNVAYNFVKTDYMCYIDNDMFFPKFVDLINIYKKMGCMALQPFKTIRQVKITTDNGFKIVSEAPKSEFAKGGVTFVSTKNFELAGGMSNLYIGYGSEDVDFNYRCKGIKDIDGAMCHIQHPERSGSRGNASKKIASTRRERDIKKDTFKDTKYTFCKSKTVNNVHFINVKDITVKDNFAYKDVLDLYNKK